MARSAFTSNPVIVRLPNLVKEIAAGGKPVLRDEQAKPRQHGEAMEMDPDRNGRSSSSSLLPKSLNMTIATT